MPATAGSEASAGCSGTAAATATCSGESRGSRRSMPSPSAGRRLGVACGASPRRSFRLLSASKKRRSSLSLTQPRAHSPVRKCGVALAVGLPSCHTTPSSSFFGYSAPSGSARWRGGGSRPSGPVSAFDFELYQCGRVLASPGSTAWRSLRRRSPPLTWVGTDPAGASASRSGWSGGSPPPRAPPPRRSRRKSRAASVAACSPGWSSETVTVTVMPSISEERKDFAEEEGVPAVGVRRVNSGVPIPRDGFPSSARGRSSRLVTLTENAVGLPQPGVFVVVAEKVTIDRELARTGAAAASASTAPRSSVMYWSPVCPACSSTPCHRRRRSLDPRCIELPLDSVVDVQTPVTGTTLGFLVKDAVERALLGPVGVRRRERADLEPLARSASSAAPASRQR